MTRVIDRHTRPEKVEIRHRNPRGATVRGRDHKQRLVLVSGLGLRGGLDWFAEAPWVRVLPGYDYAPEVRR